MKARVLLLSMVLLVFVTPWASGQDQQESILDNVGLDQKLGSQVPSDLQFVDDQGRVVRLGDFFQQGRPVLLTLVYYECPMLCTLILNGTVRALRTLEFSAGKEFEVLTVSINPRETPELAGEKRAAYLDSYRREGAENGWHFLTGQEDQIKLLADAVGYRYAFDPVSGEFAHASGIILLTPEGKVARYFYGVEYSPRDIRLGMVEASANRIGSPVDQLLLFCYHYDPLSGKYSFAVMSLLRIAGALTLLGIVALIFVLLRRERRGAAELEVRA